MADAPAATAVTIRPYRPTDHRACRALWVELTEQHRRLYGDANIGGSDPGAAFEDYLTRLDLSGMWVAEHAEDGVSGFVGLLLKGRSGEVDPIVVAEPHRGKGVGRALLGRVADEARRRGLGALSIAPVTRNLDAIHCFHRAGYTVLAHVTLSLEVSDRGHTYADGIDLHGLHFQY